MKPHWMLDVRQVNWIGKGIIGFCKAYWRQVNRMADGCPLPRTTLEEQVRKGHFRTIEDAERHNRRMLKGVLVVAPIGAVILGIAIATHTSEPEPIASSPQASTVPTPEPVSSPTVAPASQAPRELTEAEQFQQVVLSHTNGIFALERVQNMPPAELYAYREDVLGIVNEGVGGGIPLATIKQMFADQLHMQQGMDDKLSYNLANGLIEGTIAWKRGERPSPQAATASAAEPSAASTSSTANVPGLPKASCGDRPSGGNDTWYPVFIDGGNLQQIRTQYCADAVATTREDTGVKSVQLASFTNRSKAQQFAQLVNGEVGAPSYPKTEGVPEQVEQVEEQPVAAVEHNSCDPAYPGICIPAGSADLDCGDIPHQGFQVLPPDPHRLDRDKDGIGCES